MIYNILHNILKITSMSLVTKIEADANAALKSKDAALSTLRMMRAALKNAAIEARVPALDDEKAVAVISSEVKKLRDALEQFRAGGRPDLISQTEAEIAVMSRYLPAQVSEDEIRVVVARVASGASPADFGKVMGAAMKELKGKADGNAVGKIVKEVLGPT